MYYFVLYTLLILLSPFALSYDINKSYSKPSDFLDSLRDLFSGDGVMAVATAVMVAAATAAATKQPKQTLNQP